MKRLKIREGITKFNGAARDSGKKKMTLARLSRHVFQPTDRISQATGLKYLSQWDSGDNMGRVEQKYIDRTAKALGLTSEELVEPVAVAS
jgi:hypothetical protein